MREIFLLFAIILLLVAAAEGRKSKLTKERVSSDTKNGKREGRLFSLFNIVQFKQESCQTTTDATTSGTCMTTSECSSASGVASGNCAAGFGVCCVFSLGCGSGLQVNKNCTYLQNSQYPSSVAASTASSCSYTFNRICPNLCQIRLDFNNFVTTPPPIIVGTNPATPTLGTCTIDSLALTGTPAGTPLCGTLTGQHIYMDAGIQSAANAGTATFAFGAAGTGTRTYRVKVTYYTCDSTSRAPPGCAQYLTGTSGSFQSYNYNGGTGFLLNKLNYNTCVRQELGYCSISYSESTVSPPADSFNLLGGPAMGTVTPAPNAMSVAGANANSCVSTYITLSTSMGTPVRFCGNFLNSINGQTVPGAVIGISAPFTVRTGSNYENVGGLITAAGASLIGYSLDYSQIPCN